MTGHNHGVTRGRLRIYLGAAPGVGKTVAMLGEGRRRLARGTDVVVGLIETHGRAHTAAAVEDLEVIPRARVPHGDTTLAELDVDAVLRRSPEVCLVDELAHRNASGSRHRRRWEDIEDLLDAGIDVISTVNIQHLESLGDVVHEVTGVRQHETVPDELVRSADQIELVDMAPEALRRRLAHGNVYPAERVDAALSNYFRPGNLSALRELALLWVADRVDEYLERYRDDQHIDATWATRERVLVALTGGPEQEVLLRRGARIAARGAGGKLFAVRVIPDSGLIDGPATSLARARELTQELGGELQVVTGSDIAASVLEVARGMNASQIVIGASRRSPWQAVLRRGVGEQVVKDSGEIDVLMVSHAASAGRRRRLDFAALSDQRVITGWVLAVLGSVLLAAGLHATRDNHDLPPEMILFLALTVLVAIVGGLLPAVVCAVVSSLLLNWFFTNPHHSLTISEPQNIAGLAVFVVVAVAVSSVVHLSARRAMEAHAAERDSRILADLAHTLIDAKHPVDDLVRQALSLFDAKGAAVVRRGSDGAPGSPVAVAGDLQAAGETTTAMVDSDHLLLLRGPVPPARTRRLVEAVASHTAAALRAERLSQAAHEAALLAQDNRARGALLAAVSHDLRTPLAAIKAGVSGLRSTDVTLDPDDQAELLAMVEESADRLDAVIGNLLDLSRIRSGSVRPHTVDVEVTGLLASVQRCGPEPDRVQVHSPPHLTCLADPGLVDRVLGNLLENAVRHAPGSPVTLHADQIADAVEIRVSDRGPGIDQDQHDEVFAAFQRLGDAPRGSGVGLGLAVARGLAEAMSGSLLLEDTPGGGITMVLRLPAGPPADPGPAAHLPHHAHREETT